LNHLDAKKMRPSFTGFCPARGDGTIAALIPAHKTISAPIPRWREAR